MNPREILERVPRCRALVFGDVCLDRWCTYDPRLTEPSRETGIDRVAVTGTQVTPGAGGTVASNLAALGAGTVGVLGLIGDDGHGYELRAALRGRGIDDSLLVTTPGPTFTYTKLLNAYTQVEDLGRVDFLSSTPPPDVEQAMIARLMEEAPKYDCVLVADQMEAASGGAVTAAARQALARLAAAHPNLLIWIDSRLRIELFRGVALKPNEREANEACERLGLAAGDYRALQAATSAPLLMVTQGGDGVVIYDKAGQETRIATRKVENPIDICGAGDSFSAGSTLALASGASPTEAANFAHLVTSVTIMKSGTGTASPAEVLEAERRLG